MWALSFNGVWASLKASPLANKSVVCDLSGNLSIVMLAVDKMSSLLFQYVPINIA